MSSLYIDASAIIAVINKETEEANFTTKLEAADEIYSSAVSQIEVLLVLCNLYKPHRDKPIPHSIKQRVEIIVNAFFADYNIRLIPIAEAEAQAAMRAYMLYGKGTGAKANLNMGDCFSYACAAARGLPLLYKGNDFIHTDIARA